MPTRWLAAAFALEPFADLDRNDDGRLNREEASGDPVLQGGFTQLDENHDGELSAREYLRAAER
jgi:hypothetical protein